MKAHLTHLRSTTVNLWLFKCHEHDVPISVISFMMEKKSFLLDFESLEVYAIQMRPGQNVRCTMGATPVPLSTSQCILTEALLNSLNCIKPVSIYPIILWRLEVNYLTSGTKCHMCANTMEFQNLLDFELKSRVQLRRWPVFGTRFYFCF